MTKIDSVTVRKRRHFHAMHTQCLADFKYQLQKIYLIYGPFILKFIIWKPCFFVVSEKGHPIRYSLKEQRKDFLWIFSANFNQMSWHWMPSLWWPNKSNSSIWQQNTGNLFPCFCKFWKVTYFCGVHKIILANILSILNWLPFICPIKLQVFLDQLNYLQNTWQLCRCSPSNPFPLH